MECLARASP